MAINFIPNDAMAGTGAPKMRKKKPRAKRAASRATFQFFDEEPQGLAEPGTPQFLFWQAREAALSAVATWEAVNGNLNAWQGDRKSVPFIQDAVVQLGAAATLNAFYNRSSFQFFQATRAGKTTFSGESTDTVAHEVGHGLLDSIRPELMETTLLEVGAFHEAFGDCVALMTALHDPQSRSAVRASLGTRNFLETTSEELSNAVRLMQANHNAAEPRHALNTLKWQLPSTLPANGGPGVLINEEHSFARIFSGAFYDLIVLLAGPSPTSAALLKATLNAGRLLIAGAKGAPVEARFFQAVGRAMMLSEDATNGGANRELIKQAFLNHGIQLGTSAMLAPLSMLGGKPPTVSKSKATLSAAMRRELAVRLGVKPSTTMTVSSLNIGGQHVAHTRINRQVELGRVHRSLRGCVARISDTVLVGGSGGRAAVLGAFPETTATDEEVLSYVDSLVAHDRIRSSRERRPAKHGVQAMSRQTHEIERKGGRGELKRVGFACSRCSHD